MKKLISILAALAVVTTCSLVGFAADFTIPSDLSTITKYEKVTEGEDAGLYVVPLADVAGSQAQTTILAVKGDTISVGSIQYINQSADTTFKFDLKDELTENVYVLAGGSDIEATLVGYMTIASDGPVDVPVTSVTIGTMVDGEFVASADADTAIVGDVIDLTSLVAPDDATDKTVVWTTSEATTASVDNGVVTALGRGSVVITATAGEVSDTITLKVYKLGDVNDDNAVNSSDALAVINYYLKGTSFKDSASSNVPTKVGNVNKDYATDGSDIVNSSDALAIINYYLKGTEF